MFSKYFISKPVLSAVIAIVIIILGFTAIKNLPISQFPNLTPPTVVVTASYPGADAETIANDILTPLESQIAGADGLMYMSSKASGLSGTATITCTFNIGVNQDLAAVEVQNRINPALSLLPQTTRDLGVSVQKRTSDILLIVGVTSPDGSYTDTQISNYVLSSMLDEIKKIPGAGRSQIFGQRDYAIRVWLNPDKMAALGVTSTDVANAIREQNIQVAPGRVGQAPTDDKQMWTMQLNAQGRFSTPEEFQNIIISSKGDGSAIRLKDVANVELGSQEYEYFGRQNGKPAALIGIFADANANALDTAEAVYKKMEELSKKFPKGIEYSIPYDTTKFIKISIEEVVKTLLESIVLVSLVIYLFLQSWRAAMIPILSVPVSLTGAFIGMYVLGYSINTLTLFGLVLAIGIVVDDAIVVIENMERILQTEKIGARQAAIKAMTQVSGPVIAIVLVLCAVFVPATFMGGMTGQLYKQFAATIAISVVFSGFMALTFAPAIGALILKEHQSEPRGFFRWFNDKFALMTQKYVDRSGWMIRRSTLVFLVYISTYGFILFFNKTLPTAFVPMEDQGYFITSINLPDGATVNRTKEVVQKIEGILAKEQGVSSYVAVTGLNVMTFSKEPNSAAVFVRLKPWEERTTKELSLFGLIGSVSKQYAAIKEATVIAMPPPPIRGLGPSDMFQYHILQPGDTNMTKIANSTNAFLKSMREDKTFKTAFTTMRESTPTLFVDVDREKAKSLGVSVADIFTTLQSTIGYMNINQFDKNGKTYWVEIQSDAAFRSKPEDIGRAWVRSSSGKLMPLSTFVRTYPASAPSTIEHFNGMLATTIMGSPNDGVSSGEVINRLEEMGNALPLGTSYDWEGLYYQEKLVGSKAFFIMAFALLLVYLILAALYEKWILPMSIMLAVPYGIAGAYVVVWLIPFLNNNVYFQIGLLTLIGLSAKNAILVVEFAEEQRTHHGKNIYDAAMEAARLRYRPMMMTSVAFLGGMLPLILSSGAGSASRFAIGVAMFGGMIAATFVERFFIPFLYYWVATSREKLITRFGIKDEEE